MKHFLKKFDYWILILIFTGCVTEVKEENSAAINRKINLVDGGVEVTCSCNGKSVSQTCSVDGYCDCISGSPKVVCCSSSCLHEDESSKDNYKYSFEGRKVNELGEYGQFQDDKDLSMLETVDAEEIISVAGIQQDNSNAYLRKDNYCPDQFYCVVRPYCLYRLTNNHSNKIIAGYVQKSWIYQGKKYYQNVNFTLSPKQWKTFGCFFITRTQVITFKIFSHFVEKGQVAKDLTFNTGDALATVSLDESYGCLCPGGYPEGSFICISGETYRCISDVNNRDFCYWYGWGTDCIE